MKNNKERRQQHEETDSGINLRSELGDDETISKSFAMSEGNQIQLKTNVYPISTTKINPGIYRYSVQITPEILSTKFASRILYKAICKDGGKMSENSKWQSIIYDGANLMFSSMNDLEGESYVFHKFDRIQKTAEIDEKTAPTSSENHADEQKSNESQENKNNMNENINENKKEENKENSEDTENSKRFDIKIKLIKEIELTDKNSLLHLLNLIFHRTYSRVGLTKFHKKWLNDQDIQQYGGFKIIGGFTASIRSLSNGISLIADTITRIDRQGNLYDYLKRGITNQNERNDLIESLRDMQILTTHSKKQRIIKFSSINWNLDPSQATFEKVDKKTGTSNKISLAEYFQEVYNFTVQRDDPIIEVNTILKDGERRVDLFPASCLKVTGITEAERKDDHFMNGLREITSTPSDLRQQKLDQFVLRLRNSMSSQENGSLLSKWGISINESLTVTGKVIDPPYITFRTRHTSHSETEILANQKLCFKNELKNVGVAVPPRLNAIPLVLTPQSCLQYIKSTFVPKLVEISSEIGISLHTSEIIELENPTQSNYKKEIVEYIVKKGTPSFVIIIFPDINKERYDFLKQFLTVDLGIPSQFVKIQTIQGGKIDINSVILNILFQITAKTGGICYFVSNQKSLKLQNTMVVGLSTSFKRNSTQSLPVCAMTASYDHTFARYYSDTATLELDQDNQKSDDKQSDAQTSFCGYLIPREALKTFIKKAITRYTKMKNAHPHRIVVYRDKIDYRMMKNVKQAEIGAITETLNEVDSSISLLYIVVQKKSNIKLTTNNEMFSNPPSGTVIYDQISNENVSEFYMISHDSVQGIAKPTRYTIIHSFPHVWKSDDHIAKLTHYLTCNYPGLSVSIRVPCPLMLANKLAEQSRTRLGSAKPNKNLSDFLHFL